MPRTVILGVGNTILTDDGVGVYVARRASALLSQGAEVDVLESERGGLDLVDLLEGYERLVIVDAFYGEGQAPGTILVKELADFGLTAHLFGAHGVDLPSAIEMGRTLGGHMPDQVWIVGIVVLDPFTMGEEMSPEVAAVEEEAARVVVKLALEGWE